MILELEDYKIESGDITRLYPAAIVFTGEDEETTQVSLEWFDELAKDKVKLVAFAIFLHLKNGEVKEFRYVSRDLLEEAITTLASQM
jgi:hypothetical protein